MMEIERPKITVEESEDKRYAKLTVEPLERGFGITLGNALRRILLSSLPGVAPVGIRIEGVKHELHDDSGRQGRRDGNRAERQVSGGQVPEPGQGVP